MLDPAYRWTEITECLHTGIYWITGQLSFGRFVSESRAGELRQAKVTHILNVSESASLESTRKSGFQGVEDIPIYDMGLIPLASAIQCVDSLAAMTQSPDAKAYVHCMAGQNRSPTVLWLYLIACGMKPASARLLIEEANMDSVPGHSCLVDDQLVTAVRAHGEQRGYRLASESISG